MEETPVQTLGKKIVFWKKFIAKLKNREGFDSDKADDNKINALIKDCKKKVTEYTQAVRTLKRNGFE